MSEKMKPIIKKHHNKNQYLLTKQGYWVRDFTQSVYPSDINKLITEGEYQKLVANELKNNSMNIARIDVEHVKTPNVVIVSDGYKFQEKKALLKKLPRNTTVIGVNRSLANWSPDLRMDFFLVNNPFKECMTYFPTMSYFPRCIASSRTYPDFIRRYKASRGVVYQYVPTSNENYGGICEGVYNIDDYRNPVCAAIGMAYQWGVEKLMLFCCDEAFEGIRPGSVVVDVHKDLWMYPQHEINHSLIDANLYWLQRQEFHNVKVGNFSEGLEYANAPYIHEDDLEGFFK